MTGALNDLTFDNRFTRELPADPDTSNTRRQVQGALYSRVHPTPVADPQVLAIADEVAADLGLDPSVVDDPQFAQVMAGNEVLDAMDPFAMVYGGHQFGNWAGQLGDGRAIALGEVLTEDGGHRTLQLKGPGPTPYSRTADGRAVLRSSVREFLCSEAMHHLGVPTTRALSLVTTGDQVVRDMFYDGNPAPETGAIVCRVAPSFVRFGNFQLPASRGDNDTLQKLVDFTIRNDFPELGAPTEGQIPLDVLAAWFTEVSRRTAVMIIDWMRFGFVHGVMNTDNLSILGLTIDYGPYGWLEDFDPGWTPNTTDATNRRYRYGNQPQIAYWNLGQLANAIHPIMEPLATDPEKNAAALLTEGMDMYAQTFETGWNDAMAAKLGLRELSGDADQELSADLLSLLTRAETDMTVFYRKLADVSAETEASLSDQDLVAPILDAFYEGPEVRYPLTDEIRADWVAWLRRWAVRVRADGRSDADRKIRMDAVNPKFVLRNYLAQLAIDAADKDDPSVLHDLLDTLRRPFDEQPDREDFAAKRPDWARVRPGCSMLSCSS